MSVTTSRTLVESEPEPADGSAVQRAGAAHSAAHTGIFALLLLYTCHIAAPVILPVCIAFLLSLLLAPVVGRLRSLRLPATLAAALTVTGFVALLSVPLYLLSEPAAEWLHDAPRSLEEAGARIRTLVTPIQEMQQAADEVEKLTKIEGDESATQLGKVQPPSLGEVLLSDTPRVLMGTFIVIVLRCRCDVSARGSTGAAVGCDGGLAEFCALPGAGGECRRSRFGGHVHLSRSRACSGSASHRSGDHDRGRSDRHSHDRRPAGGAESGGFSSLHSCSWGGCGAPWGRS